MRRSAVISSLRQNQTRLCALGVDGLYLFGSVARDEAGDGSDVDLLVRAADETFTIFDLVLVRDACSELLEAPVEVHDYGGYERLPDFRKRVEPDLIRVF